MLELADWRNPFCLSKKGNWSGLFVLCAMLFKELAHYKRGLMKTQVSRSSILLALFDSVMLKRGSSIPSLLAARIRDP